MIHLKPQKLVNLDKFSSRVFKVLTNNRTEVSSYIFNKTKQQWEYFSKRRRIWKRDLRSSKFIKFIKKHILPTLKVVSSETLEQVPYIKELISIIANRENLDKLIRNILTKLLPMLATSTQLLLTVV